MHPKAVAGLLLRLLALLVLLQSTVGCKTWTNLTSPEGTVSSPTDESGLEYSNNLDHCWLIRSNSVVVIKFTRFNVEACCDNVHIYANTESVNEEQERFQLAEATVVHSEFWITGITLVRFKTDENHQRTGFTFRYEPRPAFSLPVPGPNPSGEVIREVHGVRRSVVKLNYNSQSVTQAWSIRAEPDQTISVQFKKFVSTNRFATLSVFSGVLPSLEDAELLTLTGMQENIGRRFQGSVTLVLRADPSASLINAALIEFFYHVNAAVKCNISAAQPVKTYADPQSVRIELIKSEIWSLSGVIQFRAVSDVINTNVRHRCEVKLANGSSMPAQQIHSEVSHLSRPQNYQGSMVTQFALVTQPWVTTGSRIACHLLGGGFVEHPLPLLSKDSRLASPWERPLMLAVSVTAGLSLLTLLGIVWALRVRAAERGRQGNREIAIRAMKVTRANSDSDRNVLTINDGIDGYECVH